MILQTDQPILLAIVGMPGSGKDTCTDYIAAKYNVPIIHFGHMVYDEVYRRGLDIVKDEKEVREDMRAKEGGDVLARRVAVKAHQYIAGGATRLVLNGLYGWNEYKYLAKEFGGQFLCVAITAPRALRYERIVNRKDAHRQYTVQQIMDREVAEIENSEKGGPIARADYTLTNNTNTPDDLFKQLDELLKTIKF